MHLSRNYLTSFNVMLCWFCRAIPAALRFWIPATIQFPSASGWLSAAILCRISCECENYLAQLTQFALYSQDTGSSNLIIPGHNCPGCIYSSRNGYRSTTMLWNISGQENHPLPLRCTGQTNIQSWNAQRLTDVVKILVDR